MKRPQAEKERPEPRIGGAGDFDPGAVGVYVHVPYCASICGYCDFFREKSDQVPAGYEALLLREAEGYRQSHGLKADSLYFGGGTPSLLEPSRLARFVSGLGEIFSFSPGAEVTLEANPETVTRERIGGWRDAGITRLSVGVQSLDPRVLSVLDRRATADQALGALEEAAASGFTRLSADVMSAVPGQDARSLLRTVARLADLPIDHLSLYSLDLHRGTRLQAEVAAGRLELPGDDEAADLYLAVRDLLLGRGFEHYEVSNFARPGGKSRHNLRYWLGAETVGLGPSAWSRFRGRLYGNPRSIPGWEAEVMKNRSPFDGGAAITPEQARADRLIFGLRLSDGVRLDEVAEVLSGGGREPERLLKPLVEHGYARVECGRLALTAKGFFLSSEILTYLLPPGWRASASGATEEDR
jgi:oxygen-independent coproporphyrinogen-3 oxidase